MPQQDPLDSITIALGTALEGMGLQNVIQGYPDSKFFTVDGRLPSLFVYQVSDNATNVTSAEQIHAVYTDENGNTTVYREKQRITYLLQLSLFANSVEDRNSIGWKIQQYLATNRQLQIGIPGVETAVFRYKGQHNPAGETNFYQRDMNFEVTARVLSEEPAYMLADLILNDNS